MVQDTESDAVQAILTALEASITAMHVASQPNMPQQACALALASVVLAALLLLSGRMRMHSYSI